MKTQFILLLTLLYSLPGAAQYSISGNFTPAKEFKWLIAYELTPGSQRYVADTAIKEGYFKLELPENASPGMYRLVYAVPQDEFYIDVIYNGKENIEFNFNLEDDIHIVASEENRTYYNYLSELIPVEEQLKGFYQRESTSKKEFKEITKRLSELQSSYEEKGDNMLVSELIKANAPYIPGSYEDISTYTDSKKKSYLDNIPFDSRFLQASGFLKDKLSNYIFNALPPLLSSKDDIQNAILENVAITSEKIENTPVSFKTEVFHDFWKTANANGLYAISDAIFSKYLKDLATENGEQTLIDEIELSTRLRIGAISPEIVWTDEGATKTLSGLKGADNYILVFWSSTCSHCLKELPALHKELTKYENIKVVAVGLEDNDTFWKQEKEKLPNFEHAIALGKWESEYADIFGIQQTPTYFILDTDKRFVAKPEDDKEVGAFLNKAK